MQSSTMPIAAISPVRRMGSLCRTIAVGAEQLRRFMLFSCPMRAQKWTKSGRAVILAAAFSPCTLLNACGGNVSSAGAAASATPTAAPSISTTAALNDAVIVTLVSASPGASIYYTLDDSTPSTNSTRYLAPFLVASNLTVKAIAQAGSNNVSNVSSQAFNLNIPSGTLVWSDEFSNVSGANTLPNPATWMYLTGADVNSSVDIHCAYGSSASPCSSSAPNSYVGTDNYLHIIAQQPSSGVYTSARMETQGLFSFQYGRLEARIKVPEGQGIWPAFWLEGNNDGTVGWPACGEMDVMERINAAGAPSFGNPPPGTSDWNQGSIHGTGLTGGNLGTTYYFTGGATAASWHTYGMIKTPNSVSYYVDDPSQSYVTYTPSSLSGLSGAIWPFDNGQANYLILNIAIGGTWPGPPNPSTSFPAEMLVDYVRIYTN